MAGVTLELAGQAYELRLTRRALYKLETEMDRTIVEVLERVKRGSFAAMVDLVWASIVHANPKLKPEDVADMLEGADMATVAKAIVEAMAQMGGQQGNVQSGVDGTSENGPNASPQG